MNVFEIGVVIHLTDRVSGGLAQVARALAGTGTAASALQGKLNKIHNVFQSGLIMAGGGAALAAPLVYCVKEAMELQTAMGRVQIATGASNAQMEMLNQTLTKTANMTGVFSKPKLAQFAADMYSSGIRDVKQINELLPLMAKGADVMKILSHGKIGPEESAHTFSALAHQFGRYDAAAMKPIIEAAVAMAPALPGGLKTFKGMGSYVNIMGNRALGIDPVQLMALQAAVAQTSGGSGTGRGALSGSNVINFLQRSMPGILGAGLLSGKSGFAAATMGLGDKYGAATSIVNGKLDLQLLQEKIANFEKLSSLEIAQRMKAHVDMLGKKAGDELPLINRAIATGGKGVSRTQLLTQLMKYQYGSASTMAMLMGDPKFVSLQQQLTTAATNSQKSGGIDRMQGEAMKLLEPQLMRLQTNFQTLASTIGRDLLPPLTTVVTRLGDFLDKLNTFASMHPRIVQASTGLLALASGALILGGSIQIISAGFMGLRLMFGLLAPAFTAIGTVLAGLSAEIWVPIVAAVAVIGLVVTAVMNWKSIMKAVQPVIDGVVDKFRQLVIALSGFAAKAGGIIAMIPGLKDFGNNIKAAANGVAKATSESRKLAVASHSQFDPNTGKRKSLYDPQTGQLSSKAQLYQQVANPPAAKVAPTVINQTIHMTVQQVPGHDHEKCAETIGRKITKDAIHASRGSSGNSVGKSIFSGGAGRP